MEAAIDLHVTPEPTESGGASTGCQQGLGLGRMIPDGLGPVMTRIASGLRLNDATLSESHLWDAVAGMHSPEWVAAKKEMKQAEREVEFLKSEEEMPLGLVGTALDGEEVARAENRYIDALANYTIINETLLINNELLEKVDTLREYKGSIDETVQMMRASRALTRKAVLPAPRAGRSGLSGTFRKFSESLFGKGKPSLPTAHTVTSFSG